MELPAPSLQAEQAAQVDSQRQEGATVTVQTTN
jgi:hypothetical protein